MGKKIKHTVAASRENNGSRKAYPSLYQVNTRVWLKELSVPLGRSAILDDIPDSSLDRVAEMGFDWVWFLSVWTTGELGRKISREHPAFRPGYEQALEDLTDEDIGGSGFAIADYKVSPELGGDEALKRLRERLHLRGLKLMLDFVPNHMGPDHHWIRDHPDYFISGTITDLQLYPQNYTRLFSREEEIVIAYGRDPYFPGWPDTVQLDYSNLALANAMVEELLRIAGQCDGVRCDMAMLILPEVFEKTWGKHVQPFWPVAINAVKGNHPGFLFMAEVYWEMEWALQQQGFDYAYDKRLYDRLRDGQTIAVRQHFFAGKDFQDKLVRFLENHDEPRAALTFDQRKHEAAAVLTFLSPGLRFFHQGQLTGKKKKIPTHLVRGPREAPDPAVQEFYNKLLVLLKKNIFRRGEWKLLDCAPAWEGNNSWTVFLAFAWEDDAGMRALVAVNYAPHASQCFVQLDVPALGGQVVQFRDMMSDTVYDRDGNDILSRGLYLDMPDWGYHVFELILPADTSFV